MRKSVVWSLSFFTKPGEDPVRREKFRRQLGACLIGAGLLLASFEGVRSISDRQVRDAYVETPSSTVAEHSGMKFIISGALVLTGIAFVIKGQR